MSVYNNCGSVSDFTKLKSRQMCIFNKPPNIRSTNIYSYVVYCVTHLHMYLLSKQFQSSEQMKKHLGDQITKDLLCLKQIMLTLWINTL